MPPQFPGVPGSTLYGPFPNPSFYNGNVPFPNNNMLPGGVYPPSGFPPAPMPPQFRPGFEGPLPYNNGAFNNQPYPYNYGQTPPMINPSYFGSGYYKKPRSRHGSRHRSHSRGRRSRSSSSSSSDDERRHRGRGSPFAAPVGVYNNLEPYPIPPPIPPRMGSPFMPRVGSPLLPAQGPMW